MFFVVFLVFALIINAQEKKKVFTSPDELRESYSINTYDYYESVYQKNGYKLFAGEDTVSFPYDVAVRMEVVGGIFWTIQKAGTKFITIGKKIVRRWDCRNKISGFFRLPEKTVEEKEGSYIPLSMLAQLRVPGPKGDKGDKGDPGRDGKNIIREEGHSTGIIFPLSCGIAGGLVGGFGFPKEITDQTIIPGIKLQTGDGTIKFGPEKINTNTRKEFNWTGAAIGAGSGIILGYLLNEVVF